MQKNKTTIKPRSIRLTRWALAIITLSTIVYAPTIMAGVLPEDRADALYHSYDGGGVEISGPSILVRKRIGASFSASANYYVDTITSASIDVITTASQYNEERTEHGIGIDYLRGGTIMSLSHSSSDEKDYSATTTHFNISQDMFGDLTTVTMGYSHGKDAVGKTGDPSFSENIERQQYRLGLSQVLTKDLIAMVNFETITDEGYLNNPYRSVRYVNPSDSTLYLYESEVYPNTRTSNALALSARYYLPYRAALHGEYRVFSDSWGISANTAEIGYTHPFKGDWIFDVRYRLYSQTRADFYSDLFAASQAQNFLARDKELSTFNSQTIGLGVSYEFAQGGWGFIDKGTLNFSYDIIQFNYDDFRDLVKGGNAGEEPLYSFSADVMQLYVSIWY